MFKMLKVDFSRFCNHTITMYEKSISGGYSDDEKETRKDIHTTIADIQPFSGKLEREEYGLDTERAMKVFCPDAEAIHEGLYVDIDNIPYLIGYIEHWGGGLMMICERCKNA